MKSRSSSEEPDAEYNPSEEKRQEKKGRKPKVKKEESRKNVDIRMDA